MKNKSESDETYVAAIIVVRLKNFEKNLTVLTFQFFFV